MKKEIELGKIIRIITVAPIMALVMLSILYWDDLGIFQETSHYVLSIIFLTVLPLLAYPLQPFLPRFREKGREGQRNLAIVMAILGYLLGTVATLYLHTPNKLLLIFMVYFISGIGILFFNKVIKIRASGHACGVVGPISVLMYFVGIRALIGVGVIVLVYWASIKTTRHTLTELLWGTTIPVLALIISALFIN